MRSPMPGAAASAAGLGGQCVIQPLPQVTTILTRSAQQRAAQHISSSQHGSSGRTVQPCCAPRAAASAGTGDACSSTCGSLQQQQKQQQQPVQPPPLQQQPAVLQTLQQPPEVQSDPPAASSSSITRSRQVLPTNGRRRGPPPQSSAAGYSQPNSSKSRQQQPKNGSSSSTTGSNGRSSRASDAGKHQQQQHLSGAALMQQLKAATSWCELQQLVEQHSTQLNWRHSCAIVTHLAQLPAQHQHQHQPPQPEQLSRQQQQQQSQDPTQEPLLQPPPLQQQQQPPGAEDNPSSTSTQAQLVQFVQATLMPLVDSHMASYDARGLANCLWAVAKLRAVAQPSSSWLQRLCDTSQPLLLQCDAQQLSNTLWGLVQLQHAPSQAWMQGWYAAMLQACLPADSSWQPQSVSSALWALAQLYSSTGSNSSSSSGSSSRHAGSSSSSSRLGPDSQWVEQLFSGAMERVVAAARSSNSSSRSSSQVVSNMLWACVQLQQQPGTRVLQLVRDWLQQQQQASQKQGRQQRQQQHGLSEQSLANCLWALGKLHQQQQEQHSLMQSRAGHADSSKPGRLLRECGDLLLQLSAPMLASSSSQHLSSLVWGAGALGLRPRQRLVDAVMQQAVLRAHDGGLTDQQVANLVWGLSHIVAKQQPQHQQQPQSATANAQQPQQPEQQQQLDTAACIEQLLSAQVGRLQRFSSQAIGSTLLSVARMHATPQDNTLHAWLAALTSRQLSGSSDIIALVDACCALALLRQQQPSQAVSGRPWQLVLSSSADSSWLQALCSATASRLGAFTVEQLCSVGSAMAVLRFRAPVPWLTAWQLAVADKAAAGGMSGAQAARATAVLQGLPGIAAVGAAALQSVHLQLADAAVASVVIAAGAAAGSASPRDVVGAAKCVAAASSRGSGAAAAGMQQLLQVAPSVLGSCSLRQLTVLLSSAAAVRVPLQPGLLPAVLQQALQQQQQQQPKSRQQSCSSYVRLLVAVTKLSRQQQQQPQRQEQSEQQRMVLQWLQQSLPSLSLRHASPAELSMALWSLAGLCYHPGDSWLEAWVQHSTPALQRMSPQQLASCGWALTVLRHRPGAQWLALWSQSVVQAAAGAGAGVAGGLQLLPARSLALLLYSSATLACPVNTAWLRSLGRAAARQAEAWSVADVADGLWGLGQLGLRAVAEEEVLELLLQRLVGATAARGQLQQLGPHRQLQVLQAAVLLGPGAEDLKQQQQQQRRQARSSVQRNHRRRRLRWLNYRAWRASTAARAVAAAAAAEAQQQGLSSISGSLDGGSSSSSSSGLLRSREALAATVGKAAVVSARFVQLKTGRDPAAAAGAGALQPAWFVYWCRCSLQQLDQWGPQQVAAALGAFAALQWQPPLEWQQQVLAHVMQQQQQQLSVQTAAAIQSALVALQSPLLGTWRGTGGVTVQYTPCSSSSGSATAAAAAEPQQLNSSSSSRGRMRCGVISYPHHLRGTALLRLTRKQRLMRLVSWWRQQQLMQQQYAQQRQEQQEELWRAAAAAASGVGFGPAAVGSTSSASSSVSSTPSSSIDAAAQVPATGADDATSSSSSSSSTAPARRSLDNTSWGRQLQRPPARTPAAVSAAAAAGSDTAAAASSGLNDEPGSTGVAVGDAQAEAGSSSSSSSAAGFTASQRTPQGAAAGQQEPAAARAIATTLPAAAAWDSWAAAAGVAAVGGGVGVGGSAAAGLGQGRARVVVVQSGRSSMGGGRDALQT